MLFCSKDKIHLSGAHTEYWCQYLKTEHQYSGLRALKRTLFIRVLALSRKEKQEEDTLRKKELIFVANDKDLIGFFLYTILSLFPPIDFSPHTVIYNAMHIVHLFLHSFKNYVLIIYYVIGRG